MKSRVYIDTSVVGGCEDEEFKEHSLQLMECFSIGEFKLVLSSLTVQELVEAPEVVRKHLKSVPEKNIVVIQLDSEVIELAEDYINEEVVSQKMRADAQHIAFATIANVDVLVSWNLDILLICFGFTVIILLI